MKFRNYCIVVMGSLMNSEVKLEIEKIAESNINILDAKGIIIATFTSGVSPKELSDWFKLNKRNFLLFDLSEENSGFNIEKEDISESLFGFLKNMGDDNLDKRASEFLKDINVSEPINVRGSSRPIRTSLVKKKKEKRLTKDEIDNMSVSEKQKLQDEIIDNGVENMSDYDKEILNLLWK